MRLALCGLVVTWLASPSAAAAQEPSDGATWNWGLEMSGTPAALARWEATRSDWVIGVGAGLGLGDEHVRVRATPMARVGRALPAGFRIDGGVGFEWARLHRGYNDAESEIQWEITGGWHWASVLRAEAGVRWTDYERRRTEGVFRLVLERVAARPAARAPRVPDAFPGLGIPPSVTSRGRVELGLEPPGQTGSGFVVAAANPRGDPAPGAATAGRNIDRLGGGAEAWHQRGPLSTWLRWRSDLHTDPSIRARLDRIAEGLSFPVSISFSGGARWMGDRSGFGLALRHDPQAFLWMPHLAAERTAEVRMLEADAEHLGTDIHLSALRLGAVSGQTVEPLAHTLLRVSRGLRTSIGAEHERLNVGGRSVTRSRVVVERSGAVFGRAAAGDDVALRLGARTATDPWHAEAAVGYRSGPDLLDYDALLARGWHRADGEVEAMERFPMFDASAAAGRGPLALSAAAFWGDPMWMGAAVRRGNGGYVDATWGDTLAVGRIEGAARVRLGRWGPAFGWWREEPTVEGSARVHVIDESLRLSIDLTARSALVSVRSGLEEPGGAEVGVALTGPLPRLGPLRGMLGQARLEDAFDTGLPNRVGAPRRGRRLVLLVNLASTDPR